MNITYVFVKKLVSQKVSLKSLLILKFKKTLYLYEIQRRTPLKEMEKMQYEKTTRESTIRKVFSCLAFNNIFYFK